MVRNLPAMQETGFDPWAGKIPWRRKWQPTPVFLPGESHGQRSLVGCSPWGCKEMDTRLSDFTFTFAVNFEFMGNLFIYFLFMGNLNKHYSHTVFIIELN